MFQSWGSQRMAFLWATEEVVFKCKWPLQVQQCVIENLKAAGAVFDQEFKKKKVKKNSGSGFKARDREFMPLPLQQEEERPEGQRTEVNLITLSRHHLSNASPWQEKERKAFVLQIHRCSCDRTLKRPIELNMNQPTHPKWVFQVCWPFFLMPVASGMAGGSSLTDSWDTDTHNLYLQGKSDILTTLRKWMG
jgi:hypothetical protein